MNRLIKYFKKAVDGLRSPFRDEVRAVRAGLKMHEENEALARLYRLCRQTHALEKGLMMPSVRKSFGTQYVEQAVDDYVAVAQEAERSKFAQVDKSQLGWIQSVLSEYFSIVEPLAAIDKARNRFEATNARIGSLVDRNGSALANADSRSARYSEFLVLAKKRKSVRWFEDRQVPRTLLDQAVEVARFAPSACNRQPFVFHILDEPSLVTQVLDISWGVSGFKENVPVVVVVVGRLRAFAGAHDRHLIYVDGSLAAMVFMLALETLGLASCPINSPDVPEKNKALAKALHLETDERPVLMMAVGYPKHNGRVAVSRRRDTAHLRRYAEDSQGKK